MKKLLAYRKFDGLGDLVMAMSVLKMVNQQYPDIDINVYVDEPVDSSDEFSSIKLLNTSNYAQHRFLQGIYDVIDNVDVKLTRVSLDGNCPDEYDYFTGHMVYPYPFPYYEPGKAPEDAHCIQGMVNNFNKETKLDLKYDKKVLAQFTDIIPFSYHKPYVVMPSCGRYEKRENDDSKSWGYDNYNELAKRLKEHYSIIQIGSPDQPIMHDVDCVVLGAPLKHVLGIMKGAEFYVGEINGLVHLAGHHGILTYAIYCGQGEHPRFTGYDSQVPTWGKTIDHVYITIEKKGKVAQSIPSQSRFQQRQPPKNLHLDMMTPK